MYVGISFEAVINHCSLKKGDVIYFERFYVNGASQVNQGKLVIAKL